ncbi:MAG TPA: hypothetical protein ENI23_03680 [bacterium]|nr:hypothetical protein [bacterium]
MATFIYDAKQVDITITRITDGESLRVSGFEDGEFITVVMDEDDMILRKGSDNTTSVAASNNSAATTTLTLQETSDSNNFLYVLRNANLILPGSGFFMFNMKCATTGETFTAPEMWVMKPPDSPKAREVSPRAWNLQTGNMAMDKLAIA